MGAEVRSDDLDELTDVLPEAHSMAEMKAIGERERALIPLLAHVLEALVEKNDRLGQDRLITAFHALKAPGVGVMDYVERIRRYSMCSPCCFIVGLVFMDRFMQRTQGFVLNSLSIHRLMLTSVLLASKFLDDFYYNNAYWARIGGIPVVEMNSLELELLFRLNFDLHVSTEDYCRYRATLLASWARPQRQAQISAGVAAAGGGAENSNSIQQQNDQNSSSGSHNGGGGGGGAKKKSSHHHHQQQSQQQQQSHDELMEEVVKRTSATAVVDPMGF